MNGLRVTGDVGPGINIGSNLRLVNKPHAISEKLTPQLAIKIGEIDASFLKSCPAVLIFDGRAALPDPASDGSEQVFLRSLLAQAGFLGFFLWLHRATPYMLTRLTSAGGARLKAILVASEEASGRTCQMVRST
jgi:hypothetical protein